MLCLSSDLKKSVRSVSEEKREEENYRIYCRKRECGQEDFLGNSKSSSYILWKTPEILRTRKHLTKTQGDKDAGLWKKNVKLHVGTGDWT